MKLLRVACWVCCLLLCCSCAHYSTTQSDTSYEKGQPVRTITTKVSVNAFFSAKSELTKSKVLQTDKSQSSAVGSISVTATNEVVSALHEINQILEKLK